MIRVRQFLRFPRNVLLLGMVSLLTDISSDMIVPLLPLFLTTALGASVAWLGLVEGVAETTASVGKLFSGWFADRIGRYKPLIFAGYSLSTLARPLMAVTASGWQVLIVRFSDRVGKGVRTAPRDALIAGAVPEDQRGAAFGFHRSMDNLGATLGPLAASGLLLLMPGRYRWVFWCSFIPGLLTLPFLAAVREKSPAGRPGSSSREKPLLSLRPFSGNFRWYLLCVAVFALANSSDLFLMQRARELGMAEALVPILWLALQLLRTLSAYGGGLLGDRFGTRTLVLAGWLIYAAVYGGFSIAAHTWQIWALVLVYGLFYGCTEGPERALVARLAPPGLKGTAYGVFSFTVGLVALPANALTGWLYAARWGGPSLAFSLAGGLALVAALLLLAAPRTRTAS